MCESLVILIFVLEIMDKEATNVPLHFDLNTGAKIPSVGLGTWEARRGVVGDAVIAAVKVLSLRSVSLFPGLLRDSW